MPLQKTVIYLPADLLKAVDRIARERHQSRSRFIADALARATRARPDDAEITRRLDELFADPALAEEQRKSAKACTFGGVADGEDW